VGDHCAGRRLAAGLRLVEDAQPPALERAAEIYYQIMSGYARVAERQPPVESVAPGEFARFWELFEPNWTAAAGERAFDPMMERAGIARAWDTWMRRGSV
jgi:amidase